MACLKRANSDIGHALDPHGSRRGGDGGGGAGCAAGIGFVCLVSAVGLVDEAAEWARRGVACQAGEARALVASARRRAARPHSWAAGQAEAMAILMRRQEMRTSAPIFKSLSLMVPQVASAKAVSARPMRRIAQIST